MAKRALLIVSMAFIICRVGLGRAFSEDLRLGLSALPEKAPISQPLVELGKRLYFEKALSKGNDISCAFCHNLERYGVDNKPVSEGHNGQKGKRNAPTVLNAYLHIAQFWDGRAKDVEEQALGPILNPIEMALTSKEEAVSRIKAKKPYIDLFKKAFPEEKDPVTFENIGKAIGAFERTLVTPSRYDRFIKGDSAALNAIEKRGLRKFKENGCIACHNGSTLGGQQFQKIGLVVPYNTDDLGRYEVTKKESDKYVFKVPSLRNVAKTAPYFHDGSVPSLAQAVRLMGKHQLGKALSDEDVSDIVAFLGALTAENPPEY
ncbi:MAG: cytochrome-c peroxidase [Candidatus Dadabacteria bacterium]|nr:MAG: cytochrome-c peroxidase [Candidatus Dadabacteria bacterium]